ncbi:MULTISPECIES: hypothetical protein [Rhizobium/Agrobacterium group]|uniref:hypothetical protein n=1 Tax=Rhizobium/Agrobacterium group TaxID=227290 RepID=UPI000B403BE4|nr:MULTISPECIES: hypothetical protein [Rhizobium/Agrobacterium group]MCF1484369.1 hypothetical protein [Allorhizobium ampelinum]NSZ43325.1 hypothetical protein [Agrobacterium vitis]NTA26982.1 hypothetical protein [Allorhizobium ampelinum]OVE94789.1 hypothetical protein B7W85_10830 [Allorhizobium ampelinum]
MSILDRENLLSNAVDCIEMAVEDFQNAHSRRLSAAIRNLYAGILLLFKCVLAEKSPLGSGGLLIYKDIVPELKPDGSVGFKRKDGNNPKTVDKTEIKERLKSLGLNFYWSALESVSKIRNNMEHLYHNEHPNVVRTAFSDSLPLIVQILDDELQRPAASIFSPECWDFLKKNNDVVSQISRLCWASFAKIEWLDGVQKEAAQSLRCDHCWSPFVKQVDPDNDEIDLIQLKFHECNFTVDAEDAFEVAIETTFDEEMYRAVTEGGYPNIDVCRCPDCNKMSYSFSKNVCLLPKCRPFTAPNCRVCGNPFDGNSTDDYGGAYGDRECAVCIKKIVD